MAKNSNYQLVIVESPTKAKTIEKFLGSDFVVKSSYGHIRDLQKNNFGVDVQNDFAPLYVIPDDKKEVVSELKKLTKNADCVWLASDEDREGEAISWHLAEVLGLDVNTTKRIVFHEITKGAILDATKHPRVIDMNLVNAQQARRVLDRLVGFELSPVLWHKVKPSLSAGRVQSVAVRILVDREREIFAFKAKSSFATTATFSLQAKDGKNYQLSAELNSRFDDINDAEHFLSLCANAPFSVSSVESKNLTRQPAPPFTTSTLQQEASRKLGMSVSQTMRTAQTLYEAGLITYMRTDSVNLSDTAINACAEVITSSIGKEYHQQRQFKTNTKGAQEAHEAIRPTFIQNRSVEGSPQEQRLYKLIWNRTVASQMADAKIERTSINIASPDPKAKFVTSADVIKFDGFMKLYLEGNDNDDSDEENSVALPGVIQGDALNLVALVSRERWSQRPARYNEASLVKKLEEMGIGRPSTYAPTISTIQQRGYVIKDSREGTPRSFRTLSLQNGSVVRSEGTENTGVEKNKLFPTDIGMVVTDFLLRYFEEVMSYDFTAKVESQFDEIADGQLKWQNVIKDFYNPFHERVQFTMENSQKNRGERLLGVDPKTGKNVYVRIGRFGPMAQIGESDDEQGKTLFSSLRKDQHIETIQLDEALKLFDLPRTVGTFEDKDVVIGTGRFGPYVRHDNKFVSLKKTDDPYTISLDDAILRIEEKREADKNKLIKSFQEDPLLTVLNGRWGPYIAYGKANVKIPKGTDANTLTYQQCIELCQQQNADPNQRKSRASAKSTPSKSSPTKTKEPKEEKILPKSQPSKKKVSKTTTNSVTTKKK